MKRFTSFVFYVATALIVGRFVIYGDDSALIIAPVTAIIAIGTHILAEIADEYQSVMLDEGAIKAILAATKQYDDREDD